MVFLEGFFTLLCVSQIAFLTFLVSLLFQEATFAASMSVLPETHLSTPTLNFHRREGRLPSPDPLLGKTFLKPKVCGSYTFSPVQNTRNRFMFFAICFINYSRVHSCSHSQINEINFSRTEAMSHSPLQAQHLARCLTHAGTCTLCVY